MHVTSYRNGQGVIWCERHDKYQRFSKAHIELLFEASTEAERQLTERLRGMSLGQIRTRRLALRQAARALAKHGEYSSRQMAEDLSLMGPGSTYGAGTYRSRLGTSYAVIRRPGRQPLLARKHHK